MSADQIWAPLPRANPVLSPRQAGMHLWVKGAGLLPTPPPNVQIQIQVREGLGFGKKRGKEEREP